VKLSVSKDNAQLFELDFSGEVDAAATEELSFLLGRSDECYVFIDDPQVSREHAKLTYLHGKWSIKNLSAFGSLVVNGKDVKESFLNNGDVVNISGYQINISETNNDIPEEIITTDRKSEEEIEVVNEEESQLVDEDFAEEGEGDSDEVLDDPLDIDISEVVSGEDVDAEFPEENDGADEFLFEDQDSNDEYPDDVDSDDYGLIDDSGDKTQVLQTFAKYQLEIFGEFAPFDKYVVEENEVYIGRDTSKCQLVLNDPEVSGQHALIKKNNITLTIEDLDSGNGTILNGDRINKSTLMSGDEFILGTTTFTVGVISEQLEEQQQRLMPVEENQEVEIEEIVEVENDFETNIGLLEGEGEGELNDAGGKSLVDKWKRLNQRQKIIYGGAALVLVFFLLGDESPSVNPPKDKVTKAKKKADPAAEKLRKKLKPKEREFVEAQYQLAKRYLEGDKYSEAIFEIDKIFPLITDYKKSRQIKALAEEGLREKERIAQKEREEKARAIRKKKVAELLIKAKKATEDKKVELAEALFTKILELDPENFDVPQLRLEIDAWKREKERVALEKAQKEATRQLMVNALSPGKSFYLKKDWHSATIKLEEFLRKKNMDEDLVKEASTMLVSSKKKLNDIILPLLGKARSLGEGQDLKGSYESYHEILKYHPSHEEALNEMDDIRDKLTLRSRRIYREAIISESLTRFDEAKEKFQEVQQVSPTDSEYYQKATAKLKEYLD